MRILIAFVLVLTVGGIAEAGPPKLSAKPTAAEARFVTGVQHDLMQRFPIVTDATRAGYFRYTDVDDSGSISYVNLQWTSSNPQYPSQLWYDVRGNLLGADFSVPYSAHAPRLWGIDPQRWSHIGKHIHWVITINKRETYGSAGLAKFEKAGGNPNRLSAMTIVRLGATKNPLQVKHLFVFPNIWDLQVWVKPNPDGAFAELNPSVQPKPRR